MCVGAGLFSQKLSTAIPPLGDKGQHISAIGRAAILSCDLVEAHLLSACTNM